MDRLIKPRLAGRQARARKHADRTGNHARLIGEDVAEHIRRHDHIELLRVAHELHRAVVDVQVADLDVRVIGLQALDRLAPQTRRLEHVCLVDAAQAVVALLRHLERDAHDALDFRHGIFLRIICIRHAVFLAAAALAEIDAAGQFTHNQNVEVVADDVLLERGRRAQFRENQRRAQVRKEPERRADAQKALFRAVMGRLAVPFRAAHRAQQRAVGRLADVDRLLRQRHARRVDRGAAEQRLLEMNRKAELFAGLL